MEQPYPIKRICCIGAGYVGGPTMTVIANNCPDIDVYVADINEDRITSWNSEDLDKLPVYEPGLANLVSNSRNLNLFFTTNVIESIQKADMIFLSVNTPTKSKGIGAGQASDLKWIEASARQVAKYSRGHTIVVEKSTIPVRTADTIKQILLTNQEINAEEENKKTFSVLSNPEFLAEGTAISDLQNPDRVLIGGDDVMAIESLSNIYSKWIDRKKILKTNLWSSELSKLTANAFLAQRISSINSIAAICEVTGANINEVSNAIGMDTRIGSKFLKSGPGFGGSCFTKDILNLIYLCNFYGLKPVADYWDQVLKLNIWTRNRISEIIVDKLFGTLSDKKIAILGFSFKADTNDTRDSSSIQICKNLLEEGARLEIYDPKVGKEQIEYDLNKKAVNKFEENSNTGSWKYSSSLYNAALESDAIVILTEWQEFKDIDWSKISIKMRKPSWLFDTRNITNYELAKSCGLKIWQLGKDLI